MMKIKKILTIALILLSSSAIPNEDIDSKIEFAKSRFEILNNLGVKCNYYLKIYGVDGIDKEPCQKLIRNMRKEYIEETVQACQEVIKWYTSNLKTTDPETKRKIIRGNKACNTSRYPDISHAISKMNNLRALK